MAVSLTPLTGPANIHGCRRQRTGWHLFCNCGIAMPISYTCLLHGLRLSHLPADGGVIDACVTHAATMKLG